MLLYCSWKLLAGAWGSTSKLQAAAAELHAESSLQLFLVRSMPRLVPLFLIELVVFVVQVDQAVVEF